MRMKRKIHDDRMAHVEGDLFLLLVLPQSSLHQLLVPVTAKQLPVINFVISSNCKAGEGVR